MSQGAGSGPGLAPGNEALVAGVDACYRQEYETARALLDKVLGADSTDLAGNYWLASLLQAILYDSGDKGLLDSFYAVSARSEQLCRHRLAVNTGDRDPHFYLSMTRLSRANVQSWEQKRSAAMKTILGVQDEARAALKADSGFVDAYFPLGMAEYFRTKGNRYLLGLEILGSRKKAYEWVSRAARGHGLCRLSARASLAWMFGQDKEYEQAIDRSLTLLKEYPGNRGMMRTLRDIYFHNGDYRSAVNLGREVERSICTAFPDNRYGLAENWIVLAKSWEGVGQRDSARVSANRVVAWEKHQDEVPWLRAYVKEARGLLRRLER